MNDEKLESQKNEVFRLNLAIKCYKDTLNAADEGLTIMSDEQYSLIKHEHDENVRQLNELMESVTAWMKL